MSLLALSVAFGNGVLSFAALCTAAVLPAYLGFLCVTSASVPPARRAGRLVRAAMLYVAGFSVVFVALGVKAGSAGRTLSLSGGSAEQVGGVITLGVAGLLLAAARYGWLAKVGAGEWGRGRLATAGSRCAPVALGFFFGAACTPCVGPFLAIALALAAATSDGVRGGVLLLAFALGLGVPFLLAAMGVASLPRLALRVARVGRALTYLSAGLLGLLGLLLVTGRYGVLSGWLAKLALVYQ